MKVVCIFLFIIKGENFVIIREFSNGSSLFFFFVMGIDVGFCRNVVRFFGYGWRLDSIIYIYYN